MNRSPGNIPSAFRALDTHIFKSLPSLVVIHNFNFVDTIAFPPEANSPLIVDPNTMLALAVALQCLQVVSRRRIQFL